MYPQKQSGIGVKFPLPQYLKQLFSSTYVTILNPFKFWRLYQESHLENCQARSLVLGLERCLKQTKDTPATLSHTCLNNSLISNKPQSSLGVKLKYRGVTYYRPQMTLLVNNCDPNIKGCKVMGDLSITVQPQKCDSVQPSAKSDWLCQHQKGDRPV